MQAAAKGVETLLYMVGVNYWQFELHPELMQKTLDGAVAAGVKNIILIGTVYPYGMARANPVREDHPREPHTFKGRMRKAQEDLVMQAHNAGRITRPSCACRTSTARAWKPACCTALRWLR